MFCFRRKERTNYGKIFAVTIAIVAGTCAVACVVFQLLQKFFTFCAVDEEDYLDNADDSDNGNEGEDESENGVDVEETTEQAQ